MEKQAWEQVRPTWPVMNFEQTVNTYKLNLCNKAQIKTSKLMQQ
jgi:hypothetical protein